MKYFMKSLPKNRVLCAYLAAAVLLLLSALLGVTLGASGISTFDVLRVIFSGDTESAAGRIVLYVRLPRVMGAILCGAAFSVAGVLIQGVLENRLASPSIIGVNSGAGLAVTLASAFGAVGGWRLSLFAFLGALVTVMAVSLGAKRWGASRGTVILIGVAINALLGAISDTVVTFFPDVGIMSNDFRIGDFSAVTYAKLVPASVIILISLLASFTLSSELDVLGLGEENARGLGMNTGFMRAVLLSLSACLAGAAVSLAGLLSFVGLLVPHAVRRAATSASRHLLPLSALFGAGFVALSDTFARILFAPYELPVGIIMSFLGAPFFIFILIKGKGGHGRA